MTILPFPVPIKNNPDEQKCSPGISFAFCEERHIVFLANRTLHRGGKMPSHHVIPAAAQHPIKIEATYFASDEVVHEMLTENDDKICGVVAYRLQYLRRQSISIVHKTLSETLRRECQVRLAFVIRTNIASPPILDNRFARLTVEEYLLYKCPPFARVRFNMHISGKTSAGTYEYTPSSPERNRALVHSVRREKRIPGRA
jgi:hypothetical protein